MTTAIAATPELAAEADARFEGIADPVEQALAVLRWAGETFGDDFAVTSSMADGLLAHLASRAVPGVNVVFLDTGYHFVETIGTRDAVSLVHNVNVMNVTAELTVAEQDARYGKGLFATNPDQCCAMRKVAPLGRALEPYAAWATGLRRADSAARARYLFRDGRGTDGELPPNDWESCFRGPAWTRTTDPDGRPGAWYLHMFAPEQPDLD